ncbi:MAG: ABC transporter permease, partial [Clostridiales bacterium]|nr:ABC transporter permease [Clostridiales bacterium]
RIVAWVVILQPNGILDNLLGILGFGRNTLYHTESAIIIGVVYNYLPFMILPIYTTLSKISKPLIEASRDLGCNGFNVFRKVILPLSVPGIITGITMVFVPAASVFVISSRLGGYSLVGDVIDSYFKGAGADMNAGSMLSFILMICIVICMAVMNRFDNGEDSAIV